MFIILLSSVLWSLISSQAIDQGGASSGVFQNIWQQSANSMNQMIGEFAPCKMKFNGISARLNFVNQFGHFRPGLGGERIEQSDSCPCLGMDKSGCPTCDCLNNGLHETASPGEQKTSMTPGQTTHTTHSTMLSSRTSPQHASTSLLTRTTPSTMTTIASVMPLSSRVSKQGSQSTTMDETGKEGENRNNGKSGKTFRMNSTEHDTAITDTSQHPNDKYPVYIGVLVTVSVLLCFVTIMSVVFLVKWRKAAEGLKHEQNELYFTEKSFRISMERQQRMPNEDSNLQLENRRSQRSASLQTISVSSQTGSETVLTLDGMTGVKTPVPSPDPYSPAPLLPGCSSVFQYQTDSFQNIYLELM